MINQIKEDMNKYLKVVKKTKNKQVNKIMKTVQDMEEVSKDTEILKIFNFKL
jgi:rubrerythrin